MPLLIWSNDLSVNVTEIDQQHKKLIFIINELNDAMTQGKGRLILGKVLEELVDYTVTHFKWEEQYFIQFGYSETTNHLKEHTNFVKKISDLKSNFEHGNTTLSVRLMVFLRDWLKHHIQVTDRKYTSFFHENGIT